MKKQLKLKNEIAEITRLGEFVEEVADELQLDASQSFTFNLALEEAVTNVINYAFPKEEEHEFLVKAEGEQGKDLTFQIVDDGVAFDPLSEAPEVDTSLGAEERPIGGLGIFLVQQTMDKVSYSRTDGKNILTMTKALA